MIAKNLLGLLLGLCFSLGLQASDANRYRVIPFTSYFESAGLPPDLFVNFKLKCNQKFLSIIRHEDVDRATHRVSIAIGGLVSEGSANCSATLNDLTVNAGKTFSGVEYTVEAIQ